MKGLANKRKSLNLTQAELAKMLNVSSVTVSKWETGIQSPSVKTICAIAQLFNCTVDALLLPLNPIQPLPQIG